MKMTQKYELMIIISSIITDEEIKKQVKTVKNLLGDEIVYEEIWGMRPFAYKIKNQEKGYYIVWNFMIEPEKIQTLEKEFQLMPDLLRHLISKVPEDYEPMKLKDIEEGLEKLRKEKEEKRGSVKSAVEKRKEKDAEKKEKGKEESKKKNDESSIEVKDKKENKSSVGLPDKKEDMYSVVSKENKDDSFSETKEGQKKEDSSSVASVEANGEEPKKKQTLDEKLEDILNDADLNL